jgi:hypothetical protein
MRSSASESGGVPPTGGFIPSSASASSEERSSTQMSGLKMKKKARTGADTANATRSE